METYTSFLNELLINTKLHKQQEGKKMLRELKALAGVGAALLLTACAGPGHVQSEGHYHSLGGLEAATINFKADSCGGIENSTGHVKLKDHAAIDFESVNGVDLQGEVTSTYFCSLANVSGPLCNCNEGYQEVQFSYHSKNKDAPGDGTGVACLADIGHGNDQGHNGIAEILILSGPFDGYHNVGAARVRQLECE